MNGFTTAAIPLLSLAVPFFAVGMAQSSAVFGSLGAVFLAAGIPLLIIGLTRNRSAIKR